MLLVAALMATGAPVANARNYEDSPTYNSARPAIGEWIGGVSWNDPIVTYNWTIYSDDTFTSGRLGRGENGGGTWGVHGSRLTLKYSDGFRYEGDLRDNVYAGTAYTADGRAFGGFSMRRGWKTSYVEESP